MPGPPKKPTKIRMLEGNRGHQKLNRNEPQPREGIPSCPRWLDLEARREWRRVAPMLAEIGLLTHVDRAALVGYCQAWSRYVEAERVLSEKGLTFISGNGYEQQRPEVSISQKSLQIVKALCSEFGFTPAARARLQVPEKPKADDWGAMLD